VARSSSWLRRCRGVRVTSGTGQSRTLLRSPFEATQRPSGENATLRGMTVWPKKRWGSPPEVGPMRTIPSALPVATSAPVRSRATDVQPGQEKTLVGSRPSGLTRTSSSGAPTTANTMRFPLAHNDGTGGTGGECRVPALS